jgi:small multidrug resistance family-3 protein
VTGRSIALFIAAAVAEIGGAYLMWQAIKDDRGLLYALAGAIALAGYGAVAALQPDANFGRVLAAYGGVFIIGSLLWGMAFDGFRPDRFDIAGAAVCLVGVTLIMYAPR